MGAGYTLTVAGARTLHLAAQGLMEPVRRRVRAGDVLTAIRRMAALQIDTISVVARSPYLVLWSRLGAYDPHLLDDLLADGALFEYWAHAACFLPIEDFALFRRGMLEEHSRSRAWLEAHDEVATAVRERLREAGEVRSAHFERKGRGGGWWDWKPEKIALECLFNTGEVMIARRESFQRVYAPTERVLPGWDDGNLPPGEETRRELVLKTVRALGVAPARWVPNYFNLPVRSTVDWPARLAEEGELLTAAVRGWNEPAYVHPANAELLEAAAAGRLRPRRTVLLSPFDPVVWDRRRALELFDFHYRIETYTPAPKRQYGYFTLPILHRGRLVGRLDPKAHRREKRLEVRAIHLETGVEVTDVLALDLSATLRDFAAWQGLETVEVGRTEPAELKARLCLGP